MTGQNPCNLMDVDENTYGNGSQCLVISYPRPYFSSGLPGLYTSDKSAVVSTLTILEVNASICKLLEFNSLVCKQSTGR